MIKFTHILCPTDLSESSVRPLTYAAALAGWYGARLTVLHVVPTFDPMPVRSPSLTGAVHTVFPVSREDVLEALRHIVETAGAGSAKATLKPEAGEPARTIVDQAVAISADLIVMGTHGRSGFERLMVGSVAEKVLRKAPCPVLTVPPHATAALPPEVQVTNVLCPMDFSGPALQAFGFALDLARQAGGSVTLLHVIEWLDDEDEVRVPAHFNLPAYRQHLVDDARQRLQALAAETRSPIAIHDVVEIGRAHGQVLRVAADLPADLIVMGAQGRSGLGLSLFGSTTQHVVRAAHCPVLTVRAAGAST